MKTTRPSKPLSIIDFSVALLPQPNLLFEDIISDLGEEIYGHYMGGLDDDEPPSKRVKLSSEDLSNGKFLTDLATCSSSMARPLESQGEEDEVIGSRGVVKKVEFVRIIAEALYSLGYKKTSAHLEEESGIPLHSSIINSFIQQILDEKWDDCVTTLHKLALPNDKKLKSACFLIFEQKFFHLMIEEKTMEALNTLRKEISPLCVNNKRVHELSSYLISKQIIGVKSSSKLLEELQKFLPPTIIIPENRLIHLVEQALDLQKNGCKYHNSLTEEMSLLTDHYCGMNQIPSHTQQILQHAGEVWFLQFSHDGKYLASSSSDCLVIIWEVKINGEVLLKHRLCGHEKPVSYISWSPSGNEILTCGIEEVVRKWDVLSGKCINIYQRNGIGLISCMWAPDGNKIFCGASDKSITMWDIDGKEIESWKGQKTVITSDIGITNDGKYVITVCKQTVILLFDWEMKTERFIHEDQTIVSFALSKDTMFLLVSLMNEEIHVWNIQGNVKLVAKYKGHKRSRFIVNSCFGGLDQGFIASGSEDSKVYIWHRGSKELINSMSGHSGSVNCVSWNPVNPHMLASGSDDRTIRIWGLNRELKLECNGAHSSNGGNYYCNGSTSS